MKLSIIHFFQNMNKLLKAEGRESVNTYNWKTPHGAICYRGGKKHNLKKIHVYVQSLMKKFRNSLMQWHVWKCAESNTATKMKILLREIEENMCEDLCNPNTCFHEKTQHELHHAQPPPVHTTSRRRKLNSWKVDRPVFLLARKWDGVDKFHRKPLVISAM